MPFPPPFAFVRTSLTYFITYPLCFLTLNKVYDVLPVKAVTLGSKNPDPYYWCIHLRSFNRTLRALRAGP